MIEYTDKTNYWLYFLPFFKFPATVNASLLRNFPYFYFYGDANDPNVQAAIKGNFLSLANSGLILPFFCKDKPSQCTSDNIEVYAGVVGMLNSSYDICRIIRYLE